MLLIKLDYDQHYSNIHENWTTPTKYQPEELNYYKPISINWSSATKEKNTSRAKNFTTTWDQKQWNQNKVSLFWFQHGIRNNEIKIKTSLEHTTCRLNNIITLLTAFSGYPPPSLKSLHLNSVKKIRMSTSHQQAWCTTMKPITDIKGHKKPMDPW